MTDESKRDKVQADEVEGLRELITQVLHEERAAFYPRPAVEDMEELRRSPAGAVIRLEEKVDRLGEDMAEVKDELAGIRAQMVTKAELAEVKEELADLRTQMVTKAEFHQLERRMQQGEDSTKEEFQSVRADLQHLDDSTKEGFQSVQADLQRVDESLRAEIQQVDESLRADLQRLEESLRADLQRVDESLRADLQRVDESLRADLQRVDESLRAEIQQVNESLRANLQRLEESLRADIRRLEESQANLVTKEEFREHSERLTQLEKDVRGLREDLHTQHVSTMRMFFVLLVVMIILNGDKVIQFLTLLIP